MRKHLLFLIVLSGTLLIMEYFVEQNAYTPYYTYQGEEITNPISAFKVTDFFITPITQEEFCVNEDNKKIACHELGSVQAGDILLTKSSHTLGVRHGHVAMVVDPEEETVIEALGYGFPSTFLPLSRWNEFPTVKILRLKNITPAQQQQLTTLAQNQFLGLPYNIFARPYDLSSTHCSDIIFKLFYELGYDLDSNGGLLVTPQDIGHSPLLEEIASYGFAPHDEW